MKGLRIDLGVAIACLAGVLLVGCGKSREMSLAAPSAIPGGGSQAEAAASPSWSGFTSASPTSNAGSSRLELEGMVAALAGTCPVVSFSLGGASVQATSATKYEHGHCEDLRNGAMVKVEGTKGSDGVVTAKEIELAEDDVDDDDDEEEDDDDAPGGHDGAVVELRGVVSQLNGVCPAVTFKLNRVQIKTSEATTFEGARCVDLEDGAAVKVKGVREGEGVLKASKVEAVRSGPSPEAATVELRGTIGNLRGTCPEVTFHLGRVTVSTSSRTEFGGLRCEDLRNGAFVKVTGERSGDGSVAAKSVESENHDSRTFEVKGKISGVTGSCPTVALTVGTTNISANDRTHYRGLTCADLATWTAEVVVKGQVQNDRSLVATQIVAEKDRR